MELRLRKLVNFDEELHWEGERRAEPPLRQFAVAAVLRNPWAGRGYVEDLKPEIRAFAPILGKLLTDRIVALAGGGDRIEAYGKAAITGPSRSPVPKSGASSLAPASTSRNWPPPSAHSPRPSICP